MAPQCQFCCTTKKCRILRANQYNKQHEKICPRSQDMCTCLGGGLARPPCWPCSGAQKALVIRGLKDLIGDLWLTQENLANGGHKTVVRMTVCVCTNTVYQSELYFYTLKSYKYILGDVSSAEIKVFQQRWNTAGILLHSDVGNCCVLQDQSH